MTLIITLYPEADPGSVKRGGGGGKGWESKFLDAAPENDKNRPKKKNRPKRGGGGAVDSRPPPPLDLPLLSMFTVQNVLYVV